MTTDLISLSYGSTSTALSGLNSSAASSATSSATALAAALGGTQEADAANVSKGAQTMQKLSDLASSDPEKFKEVAQQISDKLSEAANNSTDSAASEMYAGMAEKFASAAKSGTMDALTPPERQSGAAGALGQAAMKYARQSGTNPMEQLDGILSDALSGVGSTSA
ncbi:MAG: hypothetical protein ACLGQH_00010 [Acidobacteriota bacterium]